MPAGVSGKHYWTECCQRFRANANDQFIFGCRRKKDHGRAEALLIAAWGFGFRRTKSDADAIAAEEQAAFSDEDDAAE